MIHDIVTPTPPPAAPNADVSPQKGGRETERAVSASLLRVCQRSPFFATLALHARIKITDSLPTAATDGRDVFVNPDFFNNLTREAQDGLLLHEVLHAALLHVPRRSTRDAHLWNIACFPPDTWLGIGLPIECAATFNRKFDGDLTIIETQIGNLESTPEHPIYTRRRVGRTYPIKLTQAVWREASQITTDDYVLVPRVKDLVSAKEIDLHTGILSDPDENDCRSFGSDAVAPIPLTSDTAWLIGVYVAKGLCSRDVRSERAAVETHRADRIDEIAHTLGYSFAPDGMDTKTDVRLGTTGLERWLREYAGANDYVRHIPRLILNHSDTTIRKTFLDGLIAGGGHTVSHGHGCVCHFDTVSRSLAIDVIHLLAQDSLGGSIKQVTHKARKTGGSWINTPAIHYHVAWNPDGYMTRTTNIMDTGKAASRYTRWRDDDQGVWYPVKNVQRRGYSGPVYNLSTSDHTYVANGLLVHNCDIVVNGMVTRAGFTIPEGGIRDTSKEHLSTEEVFELLMRDTEPQPELGMADLMDGKPDGDGDGSGKPSDGKGKPSRAELEGKWKQALQQAKMVMQTTMAGDMPADLKRELGTLLRSQIDWRSYLWRYLVQTPTDFGSFDRRFVGDGMYLETIAGESVRVHVCIDTSGSISTDEVTSLASEVQAILGAYPHMRCDLYYADAELHGPYELTCNSGLPPLVGGGGTDFRPFFEHLAHTADATAITLAIYLTDGYGDFPERPPSMPTLWVVTPGGKDIDDFPFGEAVRLLPNG